MPPLEGETNDGKLKKKNVWDVNKQNQENAHEPWENLPPNFTYHNKITWSPPKNHAHVNPFIYRMLGTEQRTEGVEPTIMK